MRKFIYAVVLLLLIGWVATGASTRSFLLGIEQEGLKEFIESVECEPLAAYEGLGTASKITIRFRADIGLVYKLGLRVKLMLMTAHPGLILGGLSLNEIILRLPGKCPDDPPPTASVVVPAMPYSVAPDIVTKLYYNFGIIFLVFLLFVVIELYESFRGRTNQEPEPVYI